MKRKRRGPSYGATTMIELKVDEMGPNSLMMAMHIADVTFKEDGKEKHVSVSGDVAGRALAFDFDDDVAFPDGPIKNRRIVLSLSALMEAVLQYRDKFPKPPIKELAA